MNEMTSENGAKIKAINKQENLNYLLSLPTAILEVVSVWYLKSYK